jgi:hypothetical protein
MKRGYKQTPEHVEKRKRWGPSHHAWKGDKVTPETGRCRANRLYPHPGPCRLCGADKAERHHKNGDTTDNSPENIEFLCRRCHMESDGRLDRFRALADKVRPKAIEAARKVDRSVFPRGENGRYQKAGG